MKSITAIIILLLYSLFIYSQNLIVDGSVGIWTSEVGKSLEVYGNILTKSAHSGGYATARSTGSDGVTSFWMNSNYRPANHTSGWSRVMNFKNGYVGIGTVSPRSKLDVTSDIPGNYIIRGVNSDRDHEDSWGVYGEGSNGIYGHSYKTSFGTGVLGIAEGGVSSGVWGITNSQDVGYGIHGQANHGGIGVKASSRSGVGVSSSGGTWDFFAGNGTYGNSSSRRWKRNIVKILNPLYKLSLLRGVEFDWDENHGGRHTIGFIAEEVGEVLPEIVTYEENGVDAIAMDYSKMTPLLVEAANAMRQEYQEKFTEQEEKIQKQSKEIQSMKEELALIKEQLRGKSVSISDQ